jgi:hypothetical protein
MSKLLEYMRATQLDPKLMPPLEAHIVPHHALLLEFVEGIKVARNGCLDAELRPSYVPFGRAIWVWNKQRPRDQRLLLTMYWTANGVAFGVGTRWSTPQQTEKELMDFWSSYETQLLIRELTVGVSTVG